MATNQMEQSLARGLATREMAVEIAKKLKSHPQVLGVELFGSIARVGIGKDIDLIILVSEELQEDFILFYHEIEWGMGDKFYFQPLKRKESAKSVFNHEFAILLNSIEMSFLDYPLDLFFFNEHWRDDVESLQAAFPHEDPNFMTNILRDAIRII